MGLTRQALCVQRINEFIKAQLGQRAVVCCRSLEYGQGRTHLDSLNGAVCLQPLADSQIRHYFEHQINRPEIWQALNSEAELADLLRAKTEEETALLRKPLFLEILAEAYEPGTPICNKADLFNAYITKRLSLPVRKRERLLTKTSRLAYPTLKAEDEQPTHQYLYWLAVKLKNENSVELLIEQMQPSWLGTKHQKWVYRLIVVLLVGLTSGLIVGLTNGFQVGLTSGFQVGLLIGLLISLPISLLVGLINLLPQNAWGNEIRSFLGEVDSIAPVETFQFSISREARREILKGLCYGLIVGLIVGLTSGLIVGLIVGLTNGLIVGLIKVLKTAFQIREKPNQGIVAARKNIPLITLCTYPAGILLWITPVSDGFQDFTSCTYLSSLIGGITLAAMFGIFLGGGQAVIQHFILHLILTYTDKIPWNYARLLNYCVERRLMQRIGGHYRFIHKELLEHFAAMELETSLAP